MKKPIKTTQLLIVLIFMCPIFSFGQTPAFNDSISINQTFTSTSEIYPFTGQTVYGIGVSGSITTTDEYSLVKIILRDSLSIEYMIYDINSFINQDSIFSFYHECEETCFLNAFTPTSLEVIVDNAILTLDYIVIQTTYVSDAATLQGTKRQQKISEKIDAINGYIEDHDLIWIAGQNTSISTYYNEKKGDVPKKGKFAAFEYYDGGIFCLKKPDISSKSNTIDYSYVDNFDWRSRHGANTSSSAYFDNDPYKSGWLTTPTCQNGCFKIDHSEEVDCSIEQGDCTDPGYEWRGAPTCWAFGPTAHMEAMVNLYLNTQSDIDLAEQDIVSCKNTSSDVIDGTDDAYGYAVSTGIVNEECFKYFAEDNVPCSEKCTIPEEKIKIHSYQQHNDPTVSELKTLIIEDGPIGAAAMRCCSDVWSHAMQLSGWNTIEWGDEHIRGLSDDDIIFYIGCTYWIYKNSEGPRGSTNGFVYMIHTEDITPQRVFSIPTDNANFIYSDIGTFTASDIRCLDIDNDGYFNWGMGPKPTHCPECPDDPDGDDNNSGLGPVNDKGFCKIIDTFHSGFEENFSNWKQSSGDGSDWYSYSGEAPSHDNGTGPNGTPDGSDNYMLFDASRCPWHHGAHFESAEIDMTDAHAISINFAYHKWWNLWDDNWDDSKIAIDISFDNGTNWVNDYWYVLGNKGDQWYYTTVSFPPEVNKIRFYGHCGYEHSRYKDVALDDITISPISESDVFITSDETWTLQNYALGGDLIIEPNATLTLSETTVYFNDYKKIVVKPGGRLIVNASELTNYNGQWTGIQVWGNSSLNQFPNASGEYQQGYLEINEDSEINNALIAVNLWKPGDYSKTGGIIYATGCSFINNSKTVHAHNYTNYYPTDPGKEAIYFSEFRNCEFKMDSEFLGYEMFRSHVDIANIDGLIFKGCYFQTMRNLPYAAETTMGINAYNAQFQVKDYCDSNITPCPQNNLIACTFLNFDQAINALGDISSVNTFYVNNANFLGNQYGIRAIDVHNAIVLNSHFVLYTDSDCAYGIDAQGVSGFAFEENDFSKSGAGAQANYYGISITNSESVNQIYKNDFDGLSYANFADGKNWDSDDEWSGLEYLCNTNYCNYADFFVFDDTQSTQTGIQDHQGTNTLAAGNTFSPRVSTCSDAVWHFYNGGEHDVDYFYYGGGSNQSPQKLLDTYPFPSPQNTCPHHYGGGATEVVLDGQQKSATESSFLSNYNDYNSVKSLYDTYVDGGNTTQELLDIESAQPQDMWTLRAQLLGDSPHLSLEVLIAASDKTDVLTESALFDILAANPDELKKDTLIYYLENKQNPLPQYMINLLIQLSQGTTYKSALQQDMGYYKHALVRDAYDMIRSNLNDTSKSPTEFRNWQDNIGGIVADRQIIASYIKENNFTDAYSIANMLPSLYDLQGTDLNEHGYFLDMLDFYEQLHIQNRNIFQIDSLEIADLEYIASNSLGVAGRYASTILETVLKKNYACCPNINGNAGYKTIPAYFGSAEQDYGNFDILVKPNPANEWAAFEYRLPDLKSQGILSVYSASGKKMLHLTLENSEGQYLWDTRSVPDGIYYYTLEFQNKKKSGKLIVN